MTIEYLIFLVLIGICAGFLAGLFGIGGGILMVPFQYFLLESTGVPSDIAILVAFGTSLAIIVPTSLSGAYRHNKKLDNIVAPGIKLGIFGLFGGFLGGIIASITYYHFLEIIFGCLLLFVGINNLFFKKKDFKFKIDLNIVIIAIVGFFVGISSGLLGVGGGVFLIIILNTFLGYSIKKAIGISSVFICLTAIGGVISYALTGFDFNFSNYYIGYINLIHFLVISVFSIPFAYIGANTSDKISENKLNIGFSILIMAIALKMFGIIP